MALSSKHGMSESTAVIRAICFFLLDGERRDCSIIRGLTSYSGTTFRVNIKYWHDLFPGSNTGTTFCDGSDTGTTSAFPLRWHFLFFRPPPGCHLADTSLFSLSLSLSLSLFILFFSLHSLSLSPSHGRAERWAKFTEDRSWRSDYW